jgi:hypothetical protein
MSGRISKEQSKSQNKKIYAQGLQELASIPTPVLKPFKM